MTIEMAATNLKFFEFNILGRVDNFIQKVLFIKVKCKSLKIKEWMQKKKLAFDKITKTKLVSRH
jgi:hypothetical protein